MQSLSLEILVERDGRGQCERLFECDVRCYYAVFYVRYNKL